MKKNKSSRSLSGWLNSTRDEENSGSLGGKTLKRQPSRSKRTGVISTNPSAKRRCPSLKTHSSDSSHCTSVPWCLKHAPKDSSQLAVHKKKIQELQQWLQFALSKTAKHPLLLMTGPSGCGKTATLRVLASEMGFEIVEWAEPVETRPPEDPRSLGLQVSGSNSIDWELYESHTKKLLNFLTRANRYPLLQLIKGGVASNSDEGRAGTVVLIEEVPNVFLRDPKKLHQLLKDVRHQLLRPLVFIVSDMAGHTHLFPPTVITDLDMHHIHFNPIARTNTLKVLQRIQETEQQLKHVAGDGGVDKNVLEDIADCCGGDIRSAVNTLQFSSCKDTHVTSHVTDSFPCSDTDKWNGTQDNKGRGLVGVTGREHPMFLFRALGKILYCKRESVAMTTKETLPAHLSHLERPHPLTNPEDVYQSVPLSNDMFTSYLHQNYLEFFSSIDDVDPATGYLSDSDVIGRVWSDTIQDNRRSLAGSCSCSVASRGIILSSRGTSPKWRPLYKPKWNEVYRQHVKNVVASSEVFRGLTHCSQSVVMATEILPYMVLTDVWSGMTQAQKSFLHMLTNFRSVHSNSQNEQLGETEQHRYDHTPSINSHDHTPFIASRSHSHSIDGGMGTSLQQQLDETEFEEIEQFDD